MKEFNMKCFKQVFVAALLLANVMCAGEDSPRNAEKKVAEVNAHVARISSMLREKKPKKIIVLFDDEEHDFIPEADVALHCECDINGTVVLQNKDEVRSLLESGDSFYLIIPLDITQECYTQALSSFFKVWLEGGKNILAIDVCLLDFVENSDDDSKSLLLKAADAVRHGKQFLGRVDEIMKTSYFAKFVVDMLSRPKSSIGGALRYGFGWVIA
jgi:hypothetical protein